MAPLLGLLLACASGFASGALPNIIFILADDLGYNEVPFNNASRGMEMPELAALAAAGVVLDQYYTVPLCSPTRSSLMTGRYNHRLGLQSNVIYWDTPWSVDRSLQFLPAFFKAAGYASTAMFGKSHLGSHATWAYPSSRGFDEFRGYLQGCGSKWTHVASCCDAQPGGVTDGEFICPASPPEDFRGFDWFNGSAPDLAANLTPSSTLIADAAVDFIRRQGAAAAPFFLYLPFQNIHAPYDAAPASVARFAHLRNVSIEQRVIFGYLWELDVAVGRVRAALEAQGALDDAIIVFASDNGAPAAPGVEARNYPLAGFKASVYEGGTRVPAFIHAPALLAGGRRVEALAHVTDWLPTLLARAGAPAPPNIDGVDIWPSFAPGAPSARTEVLINVNPLCGGGQFGAPKAALRAGDLKLLCFCYDVAGIDNATRTGCRPDPTRPGAWPQLFNLSADPGETTNIAAREPAALAAIEARLAALAARSVEPMQWDAPFQGGSYACADCPKHPPGTGPEVPWQAWVE